MTKLVPFDASDYLDSDEMMAEYLAACLENEGPDVFLSALADLAKALGSISQVVRDSGHGRTSF